MDGKGMKIRGVGLVDGEREDQARVLATRKTRKKPVNKSTEMQLSRNQTDKKQRDNLFLIITSPLNNNTSRSLTT
jgi:hypothetical protein